ncbi:methyltransferase domain-containing protein [Cryptosporidium felis]|nr:methyltransferase domain-containing protein [Cryptosporidium felis]
MSQETTRIRFLSLSRKLSLNEIVKNFIIQCSDHNNHEIVAKFGEIKGFYSRINVNLPVACDCILEQGSGDYRFEEKVNRKQQSYLIERIMRTSRDSWTVAEKMEIDTFLEEKYSNEIVRVDRDEIKTSFCELNLGEVVVYKPKSQIHFCISGTSRTKVDFENKLELPIAKVKKSVVSWSFQRNAGKMYPFWNLKIVNVSSFDKKRKRNSDSEKCAQFNNWGTVENNKRVENDDEDDEDEYWMVILSGNRSLISKHVEMYKNGLINGLDRISNELIINSSLIAKYLDESLSNALCAISPSIAYYYPNFFGDITTSIRAHYNMKKIQSAEQSIIGGLRKYNNEVKRALIDQYFDKQLKLKSYKHINILDLACGHGQDLLKYRGKKINRLVGIDISAEEISEARHRLKAHHNSVDFSVEYHVGNLLSKTSYSKILKNSAFDIISIQLSMHYILVDEETSLEFLKNVSSYLNPGGYFIGSTISCDNIYHSVKNNPVKTEGLDDSHNLGESNKPDKDIKYVSGNSIYKIIFDKDSWGKYFSEDVDAEEGIKLFRTQWGIKYDFWLIEHINQYEYVVPWDSFCKLAHKVGLELMQYSDFQNFAEFTRENFPNIRFSNWINNPKNSSLLTHQEAEVFSLYCIFAFRKTGTDSEFAEEERSDNDKALLDKLALGFKIRKKQPFNTSIHE